MIIEARSSQIAVAPRKMRMLSSAIKNLSPQVAIKQLGYFNYAAAAPLQKVLKQAVANATNNFKLNPDTLVIKEIIINQGWTLKRWQAAARGRGKPYTKRRSHVIVKLESKTIAKPEVTQKPAKKAEAKPTAKKTVTKKKTTKSVTKKVTKSKK